MKAVIQEEATGCAIASSAAIAGLSYRESKIIANSLGIFAGDPSLWSDTTSIRTLLMQLDFDTGDRANFETWDTLPDCALLSSNWHLKNDKPYWHWVVFVREKNKSYVLDSNASLESQVITNLNLIEAKWFIPVSAIKKS